MCTKSMVTSEKQIVCNMAGAWRSHVRNYTQGTTICIERVQDWWIKQMLEGNNPESFDRVLDK